MLRTMSHSIALFLIVVGISIRTVDGFNLDVKNPVMTYGKSGSYFGYSLTVHQNNNVKWLLIGAPRELDTYKQFAGAVYQCDKRATGFTCNRTNVFQDQMGSDQWLGATVVSQKGSVLACAPRTGERVTGRCFYGRGSLTSFDQYNPWNEDFCEVGFSAAFSMDGNRLYTGGPSCNANAGRMFASNGLSNAQLLNADIAYFSYSMASGKILNGYEGLVVSVGFHQSSKFAGKVLLVDSLNQLKVVNRLDGYQSGEQFGASLAVTDVNRDGRDDIIIGAPYHTDYENPELKYEIGAVYIYYQTNLGVFQRGSPNELILKGQTSGGRFGFAVAALGDINLDGYNDIAVSAPFENEGAVYIYHGSEAGIRNQPGQMISGNSFSPPISSFGYSLSSSASDLDDNKYNDVFVGAYQSDAVVYLPARPVVLVTSEINFNPEYITLENKKCQIPSGGVPLAVSCAKMTFCLTYNGQGTPATISANISIGLDVRQQREKRLLFIDSSDNKLTQIKTLNFGSRFCQDQTVYVKPDIRDKLSSMDVALLVKLVEPARPPPLSPILDIYGGNGFLVSSLSIFKDCGPDLICIPDLQLKASMDIATYVQGSTDRLKVDVLIFNAGEDAFGAEFYLHLPPTLSFINTDREVTNSSVLCFAPGDVNGPSLRCEIGNPLSAFKTIRLRVILQPNPGDEQKFISFWAETNCTNKERPDTLMDNKQNLNLNFKAETSLPISGWSTPESLAVNVTALQNDTAGSYSQFFEMRNGGPSDILSARLQIVTPTRTPEGYAISELATQPVVTDGLLATCDPVDLKSQITIVNCESGRLKRQERVVIRLLFRILSEALIKQNNRDSFEIISSMTANITSLPYDQDVSVIAPEKTEVKFKVSKIQLEANLLKATPWWVVVAATVGGAALLAVLAVVLNHFGFFKRNRPPTSQATLEPATEGEPAAESREMRPMSEARSEIDRTVEEESE